LKQDLPATMARVDRVAASQGGVEAAPIRRTRSYLFHAMGEDEKAIAEIKAFLVSDELPQAAFFHRLRGESARRLGRRAEALTHLKRAVALDREEHEDLLDLIRELEGAPAATSTPAPAPAASTTPPAPASGGATDSGRPRGSRR
jgi:tetratricopeptide (TPR) repeat protein